MRRLLATVFLLTVLHAPAAAQAMPVPAEAAQTPMRAMAAAVGTTETTPALVARVAERFLGTPYGAQGWSAADNLACAWNAFDCVTLVESSLAIARALQAGDASQPGYVRELATLRFRGGQAGGFASRLHYFSDWVRDNVRRGHLQDLTAELGGERSERDIHYMTAHWSQYQKEKVEADFAAMREVERALTASPRYVLPKSRVAEVADRLQSGDIIAIATGIDGLDVVHVGLAYRKPDGKLHLLHAPVPGDVVCVSRKPLADYLQVYDAHVGIIVARPQPPAPAPWWAPLRGWFNGH